MHSITTENDSKKVELDTFKPPHHKLKQHIETKLTQLLKNMILSLHKMKRPLELYL